MSKNRVRVPHIFCNLPPCKWLPRSSVERGFGLKRMPGVSMIHFIDGCFVLFVPTRGTNECQESPSSSRHAIEQKHSNSIQTGTSMKVAVIVSCHFFLFERPPLASPESSVSYQLSIRGFFTPLTHSSHFAFHFVMRKKKFKQKGKKKNQS